jgi:hypothetical protein
MRRERQATHIQARLFVAALEVACGIVNVGLQLQIM